MNVSTPIICTTVAELREHVAQAKGQGQRVGLVPTMGALHAGHLSLANYSIQECGYTVVTIFVNPTQFAPHEDYTRYPRVFEADCQLLSTVGVNLVFAPDVAEVYPPGCNTHVEVGGVTEMLEGECRPGHFRGVATVVLKLFLMAGADVAYFGRKDYQQAAVVQQMVRDLNVPITIRTCPIVRESDGLALSSRNVYLSPDERRQALVLSRSLQTATQLVSSGEQSADRILAAMHSVFATEPLVHFDYIALVDPVTLQPVSHLASPTIAAVAARVGKTRLIDNTLLEP